MDSVVFCTYFDKNYRRKGMALYRSIMKYHPSARLYILALDEEIYHEVSELNNVIPVRVSDIENRSLMSVKSSRKPHEYYWTMTPHFTLWCLRQENAVSYIDADCFLFDKLDWLYEEISSHTIGIVPHRFATHDRQRELENGIYNVGIVYFKYSMSAMECLGSWGIKTVEWCYHRSENGKMGDQGYLNEWPERHGAYVVQNLGVDLGPWNQMQYSYRKDDTGIYVSNGSKEDRLLLYHFHEHQMDDGGNIIRRTNWQLNPFISDNVYPVYERELMA